MDDRIIDSRNHPLLTPNSSFNLALLEQNSDSKFLDKSIENDLDLSLEPQNNQPENLKEKFKRRLQPPKPKPGLTELKSTTRSISSRRRLNFEVKNQAPFIKKNSPKKFKQDRQKGDKN